LSELCAGEIHTREADRGVTRLFMQQLADDECNEHERESREICHLPPEHTRSSARGEC
jgi:hypothetical protein